MKNLNFEKDESGFTMIEIAVVMIVLGVLAIMVIPNFMHGPKTINDDAAKSEAATLNIVIVEHKGFNAGKAPVSLAAAGYVPTSNGVNLSYKQDGFNYCIKAFHPEGDKVTASNPFTIYNGVEAACPATLL